VQHHRTFSPSPKEGQPVLPLSLSSLQLRLPPQPKLRGKGGLAEGSCSIRFIHRQFHDLGVRRVPQKDFPLLETLDSTFL